MARHTVADITYSEIMEEKRVAMLNHIVGVCQHPQNRFYRACGHGDKKKERLDPGRGID